MSETVIYISKRCPHCRTLLMKVQQREDIKGTIRISSIDDEPFPNAIKNVPSMIAEGVIYEASEIFRMLEESEPSRRSSGGPQGQPQGKPQGKPQGQPQGQAKESSDDMYSGYCENGSCLAFSSLDDSGGENEYAGQFAPLDHTTNSINVSDDGYKKSSGIDNDYERMMKERGELTNNQQIR